MPVQLVQDMDERVYPMFGNRCSELEVIHSARDSFKSIGAARWQDVLFSLLNVPSGMVRRLS